VSIDGFGAGDDAGAHPAIASGMINALSIDVEDWYHDQSRRDGAARPEEVAHIAPRVERNLEILLAMLADHGSRATLFFLAEVAERHPHLVHTALAAGHEIGSHGLEHRPVAQRSPAELRADLASAKDRVECVAGVPVRGFRAPCFISDPKDLWALDVVAGCGFAYDSSYMPLRYYPGKVHRISPRGEPVRLPSGLWEFPLPLSRVPTGHVLPCAAGGFALRALPFAVTRHYLRRFNAEVGPAVVYTHPWEIDPDSPKLPGTPGYVRVFNRIGRGRMERQLRRLLGEFRFAPLAEVYADLLAQPDGNGAGAGSDAAARRL
jgi:polysaccharide deacetylase family protein (PEP-CTERM system associated)